MANFEKLKAIQEINASKNLISGIQTQNIFCKLKKLDLSSNKITKISDLRLDKFPHLETLNLNSNLIEEIKNLAKLSSLKILKINKNKLKQVDMHELVQNCPNLEYLSMRENKIWKIFSSSKLEPGLKKLVDVDLDGNELKSLDFLKFLVNVCIVSVCDNKIGKYA